MLYPDQREVHLYGRGSDTVRVYVSGDQIDAEALLPGIGLKVDACFATPDLGE